MLYLVRHGESIFNRRHLLCGRSDVPLTEKGLYEARVQGERLKGHRFDLVYCSPLYRTRQTMEQILSVYEPDERPQVVFDERIIERDFGYFEAEADNVPGTDLRWHMDFEAEQNCMESLPALFQRAEAFVQDIRRKHAGRDILAVTHNGMIRMIKCVFHGFPESPDLKVLGVKNAQVEAFVI